MQTVNRTDPSLRLEATVPGAGVVPLLAEAAAAAGGIVTLRILVDHSMVRSSLSLLATP